jgi:predicted N-acetyltransferase YhbS
VNIKLRQYNVKKDFKTVGDFLVKHYLPENRDGNYLQPAWEYMHSHPYFKDGLLDSFRIWEDDGKIVGVVHPESLPEEAFFEIHPDYPHLKAEMFAYTEEHIKGRGPDGRICVLAFINDFDKEFEALAEAHGYAIFSELARPMAHLPIPKPFPSIHLAEGFRLQSLADENDLAKLDRCVWRGFNHGDEPPAVDYAGRKKMQSAPSFRKDLNIVAVEPGGNYVAYAGLWFEPVNKFAYVEPVCTDPDYRLRGLGKAAVLEGIRRCSQLGATVAYVGNTLPIYLSIGFKRVHTCNCWRKYPGT